MKLSIFQAALDQLHMEVSVFQMQHFKLCIFIQYVKVHEIDILFLIITLLIFLHFAFSFPLFTQCGKSHCKLQYN